MPEKFIFLYFFNVCGLRVTPIEYMLVVWTDVTIKMFPSEMHLKMLQIENILASGHRCGPVGFWLDYFIVAASSSACQGGPEQTATICCSALN